MQRNKNTSRLLIVSGLIVIAFICLAIASTVIKYRNNPPDLITEPAETTTAVTNIAFVGDMMFDRYIRASQGPDYQDIFDPKLQELLGSVDGVVGNLEGPISNLPSVSNYDQTDPNHYRFTFDPKIADILALHNFMAVSLGNNHINNFGHEGIDQTISYLDRAQVGSFGDPRSTSDTYTAEINGHQISFVAYNYAAGTTVADTIQAIGELDNISDFVIVLPHWGQEYQSQASSKQTELARSFVAAGADLIIGAHPHVMQNFEMIDGAPTYYSLGNFVFDQYFNESVRCGLIVVIEFDHQGLRPKLTKTTYLESTGVTRLSQNNECSKETNA